jgi:hypothetical protein
MAGATKGRLSLRNLQKVRPISFCNFIRKTIVRTYRVSVLLSGFSRSPKTRETLKADVLIGNAKLREILQDTKAGLEAVRPKWFIPTVEM